MHLWYQSLQESLRQLFRKSFADADQGSIEYGTFTSFIQYCLPGTFLKLLRRSPRSISLSFFSRPPCRALMVEDNLYRPWFPPHSPSIDKQRIYVPPCCSMVLDAVGGGRRYEIRMSLLPSNDNLTINDRTK